MANDATAKAEIETVNATAENRRKFVVRIMVESSACKERNGARPSAARGIALTWPSAILSPIWPH
jgi:hypothetical protein